MNTDLDGAVSLTKAVVQEVGDPGAVRVAVCPPFISLGAVAEVVRDTPVALGAQNAFYEDEGAYTGEVSPPMLRSVGCEYVILGHSERRQYFGETDETVNKRVKQVRAHGLIPIICVGETQAQRRAGEEQEVVRTQVEAALQGISVDNADDYVFAYEPVWAIGTGDTATPEQAQEMHAFIRELLRQHVGESTAADLHILYGGSMKPDNAPELLSQPDVDGGLIGGASLKADSFAALVKAGKEAP